MTTNATAHAGSLGGNAPAPQRDEDQGQVPPPLLEPMVDRGYHGQTSYPYQSAADQALRDWHAPVEPIRPAVGMHFVYIQAALLQAQELEGPV